VSDVAKPTLVFHHIPKTAGTAFRTALFNVFGEDSCLHLREVDLFSEDALKAATPRTRLVCGHIPVRYVGRDRRDRAVTFLRDPIDRVLSLFRFILAQSAEDRSQLGLGETFTLREFLSCSHSDVVSQVDNGMCRFLARRASFWPVDQSSGAFPAPNVETMYSALEELEHISVGICERMQDSLALLSQEWGLPFQIVAPIENQSPAIRDEVAAEDIAEIAARNSLDVALYKIVATRFDRALRSPLIRESSIVAPAELVTGREYAVCELPARCGFEAYEPKPRVSWVLQNAEATVCFAAGQPGTNTLSLRVYAGRAGYDPSSAQFLMNGSVVRYGWHEDRDGWGTAVVGPCDVRQGLNTFVIETTRANTPSVLAPGKDKRALAFAIASVRLLDHAPPSGVSDLARAEAI
jgi:hypothetical protein